MDRGAWEPIVYGVLKEEELRRGTKKPLDESQSGE